MRFCGFCGMGTGLCGSFFVEWPVMALLHEIGLCNNNNFSRTWFFFRACLDCFQSPQNQHVDRVGSLKHCFAPPNLPLRASSSRPSSPKTNALTIVLQDPCLWRISPSYSLSLSELAGLQGTGGFGLGCGCGKKTRPEKWFFRHSSGEPHKQLFRLWNIVFFTFPLKDEMEWTLLAGI